jgi:hypothetical protein
MEKMIQSMMKRYPVFIGMGLMLVMIAVIIGAVNAGNSASYYAVEKSIRDSSVEWAQVRAGVESTVVWLPYLKFMGVAMILGGITMALGIIGLKLQNLGKSVMGSVPQSARVVVPPRPRSALLMRLWMVMGMMVIIAGFIISLVVAGSAASLFSNPITALDAAQAGSALLTQLAGVHAAEAWLEAFKFVGIAFMFMGIIQGLATILFALNYQDQAIPQVVDNLPTSVPAAAAAD